jgi:hypothetical protein
MERRVSDWNCAVLHCFYESGPQISFLGLAFACSYLIGSGSRHDIYREEVPEVNIA